MVYTMTVLSNCLSITILTSVNISKHIIDFVHRRNDNIICSTLESFVNLLTEATREQDNLTPATTRDLGSTVSILFMPFYTAYMNNNSQDDHSQG